MNQTFYRFWLTVLPRNTYFWEQHKQGYVCTELCIIILCSAAEI
jgi:hypothetical protein